MERKKKWTDSIIHDIRMMRLNGEGWDDIAHNYGETKDAVKGAYYYRMKQLDLNHTVSNRWDDEEIDRVKELKAMGKSDMEIGYEYGVSMQAIQNVRYRKGI